VGAVRVGEREPPPNRNANGAGIAADPTLTGVWMTCTLRDFWRTVRLAGVRAYLAPDVWPCSPNLSIGVFRLAHQSFVTGARAGIRLSLLPCCGDPKPEASGFPLPCAVAWPRPCSFTDPGLRHIRLAPSLPPVSARLPGLSGETASRSSQTSLLAFGQSLLQAVSR